MLMKMNFSTVEQKARVSRLEFVCAKLNGIYS